MSIETSKKKKGIQMPHTYIILFLIVLVVCLLTYVIPAGQFERQEDASGRMLIVPGTYTQVESSPVSPLEIPMAFVRTLGSSSVNEIIFFIFIIGGAFELIMQTGMITAFCAKLGKMFAGKEKLLIPIFITAASPWECLWRFWCLCLLGLQWPRQWAMIPSQVQP